MSLLFLQGAPGYIDFEKGVTNNKRDKSGGNGAMRSFAEPFFEGGYRAYLEELPNHLGSMSACMLKQELIKFRGSVFGKEVGKKRCTARLTAELGDIARKRERSRSAEAAMGKEQVAAPLNSFASS